MTSEPKTVRPDSPAYDALNIMEEFEITVLPVVNAQGKVEGILHLHDILGKGEFKFNGKNESLKKVILKRYRDYPWRIGLSDRCDCAWRYALKYFA